MTNGLPSEVRGDDQERAGRFNEACTCASLDHARLAEALDRCGVSSAALRHSHPHLFAATRVYVAESHLRSMASLISAIERVVRLPAWQERVLAYAPATARHVPAAAGVFLGYDFHLNGRSPQLIEINTNAGGGLLNAKLLRAQQGVCEHTLTELPGAAAVEAAFVGMFRDEWRRARGERPLKSLAIVDSAPEAQFLAPEFELFRQLFEAEGISTVIVDPAALRLEGGVLRCGGRTLDLVYNRLTDFSLEAPAHAALFLRP